MEEDEEEEEDEWTRMDERRAIEEVCVFVRVCSYGCVRTSVFVWVCV